MKCRCPYCHEISEWKKANECPLCHKFALNQDFFRKSLLKKNSRRRERNLGISSPWITNSGIMNIFSVFTRMPRWLIWVAGIAIIGAYIYAPHQKADYPSVMKLARENLLVLRTALDAFYEDCGRFPTSEEGLTALVQNSSIKGWEGPYILKLKPDPWKHPFLYVSSNGDLPIRIFSLGPDGVEGTADDLFLENDFSRKDNLVSEDNEINVNIGGSRNSNTEKKNCSESK